MNQRHVLTSDRSKRFFGLKSNMTDMLEGNPFQLLGSSVQDDAVGNALSAMHGIPCGRDFASSFDMK